MKRIAGIIFLCLIVFSCNKEGDLLPDIQKEQEIAFTIISMDFPGGEKDWPCKPFAADYLHVEINERDFFLNVYRINGYLYSESIRNIFDDVGDSITITISKFLLWNAGDKEEFDLPGLDDTIIMGTPHISSQYAEFVSRPLPYTITIPMTDRFNIPVEVLCHELDPIAK